ncbi:MAG: ceramidase, partial [Gammaproteobacteria bacterium]|nr:ceramidase [Gammaproteobacteria bacterium]
GCLLNTPNTCFCEAFNPLDVQNGAPGVRQKVNTWSNLYAIFTSLLVAVFVFLDRKKFAGGTPPNLIRSATAVPDVYIFAVLFLGLGSIWFHGSMTQWGGTVDGISMYIYAAFLPFYSIRRFYPSDRFFWIGYLLTIVVFAFLHNRMSSFITILILVIAYLIVEVYIWIRTGKIMQGKPVTIVLWLSAVVAILAASFFWWASQTGNFLCFPHSFFQPHGMLWHTLAGVMAVLLYFYWRLADDPV